MITEDDQGDDSNPPPPTSSITTVESKQKRIPTECKVCGGPAVYSYVGVIACASCKMFFKRNATTRQNILECRFDGNCEINLNNRHTCAACRLKKCFTSGMQVDLLRGSTAKKGSKRRLPTTTDLVVRSNPISTVEQLPTLDLLESDRSTLTSEQWTHLSNLIHCYDEYSSLTQINQFLREQNQIPMRIRFKPSAIQDILTKILISSQYLFGKNQDFLSLSSADRSLLLHRTVEHVAGLNCSFVTHISQLISHPSFYENLQSLCGFDRTQTGLAVSRRLDDDSVFVKIALGIILFSTLNMIKYRDAREENFQSAQAILSIQNQYLELVWRYLLYRYDNERAVRCFSNLILALFSLHQCLLSANEIDQYNVLVHSLVEETEAVLRIQP